MRDSATPHTPGYLPSLYGGGGSAGDSLLATLWNQTKPVTDPREALRQAEANAAGQIALIAADPAVKRDIAAYKTALTAAKNPARLLANPVALKVLLTVNGLGDQIGNMALAAQALLSDPNKPDSLVRQLADTRWLTVNQSLSLPRRGLSGLRTLTAQAAIGHRYPEALWRRSLDKTTPGLSAALDFLDRVSRPMSPDQVLNDPVIRLILSVAAGDLAGSLQDPARRRDPAFIRDIAHQYLLAMANRERREVSTVGVILDNQPPPDARLVG